MMMERGENRSSRGSRDGLVKGDVDRRDEERAEVDELRGARGRRAVPKRPKRPIERVREGPGARIKVVIARDEHERMWINPRRMKHLGEGLELIG